MMDAAAPRDNDQRLLVEQDLFGRRVLNGVACEGFDWVERPETYKQWQARNDRAGLRQLPLDPDIVKAVSDKVRDNYHRDFVVYVDHKWLLQGWKGRTLYAMSTWVLRAFDTLRTLLQGSKAFNTITWPFLLEVLRAFGFGDNWRRWITTLLAW
jgi:hypothetical protein